MFQDAREDSEFQSQGTLNLVFGRIFLMFLSLKVFNIESFQNYLKSQENNIMELSCTQ